MSLGFDLKVNYNFLIYKKGILILLFFLSTKVVRISCILRPWRLVTLSVYFLYFMYVYFCLYILTGVKSTVPKGVFYRFHRIFLRILTVNLNSTIILCCIWRFLNRINMYNRYLHPRSFHFYVTMYVSNFFILSISI